jgi:uncharacterized protein (DUF608 family)
LDNNSKYFIREYKNSPNTRVTRNEIVMQRIISAVLLICVVVSCTESRKPASGHTFNQEYTGEYIHQIAFPIGGMGAGMYCLEGNGSLSHFSLRHKPDLKNRPFIFAAIAVKGMENGARILEGPVQDERLFGDATTGNGGSLFGVPRFEKASFLARFPFGKIKLEDEDIPMQVNISGWSPFIPGDADNSSLPVGGLEYTFTNNSGESTEAVFSFHSSNLMKVENPSLWGGNFVGKDSIMAYPNGFLLSQSCHPDKPWYKGDFAVFTDAADAVIDYCWFRGGWFDARTLLWKDIAALNTPSRPVMTGSPGASLYVPFKLKPGESKSIRVMTAWYVPHSDQRFGWSPDNEQFEKKVKEASCTDGSSCCPPELTSGYYEPWYSGRFADIHELASYWGKQYDELKQKSELFSQTFYASELPPEVLEAVSVNLTILKSPTVLRQKDGRLWGWEGCFDQGQGCCEGSCTHVWNYAQAVSRLFPSLERSLRETEFKIDQDKLGHQQFRATLPIREPGHGWYAAADGQLGGIMKVYREWRISGNTEWMKQLWPQVKASIDFCILQWDPRHKGVIEEPHHNTYDIEFWGPDGMITGFYLGALNASIIMGKTMGDDVSLYEDLYAKGKNYLENDLFNGEYFFQKVVIDGLNAENPATASSASIGGGYSEEAIALLKAEGPKYQYGTGCLSDGVLGSWLSLMCGLNPGIDESKIKSHLLSVYRYNFKENLTDHVNPQRASYAYGNEGGLLLCTWPKGNVPSLPFVYSNEVWTGIEYQLASHLVLAGEVEKGLDIVRTARLRYDGKIRNPFDEYECGHWYARAMSSYGLIQGLTGIFFDAVDSTLTIDSKIGNNFSSFFACESGYGLAGLKNGKPFVQAVSGTIPVNRFLVSGVEIRN